MKEQKCLFVTIAGLPNPGKSTLINSIIGKKIAIVTPKVQTTRTQIRGVATCNNTQVVFTDSPGIFSAETKLEKALVKSAWSAVKDSDITLLLVDVSNYLKNIERIKTIFMRLQRTKGRCILVINKTDLVKRPELKMAHEHLNLLYKFEKVFMISALKNDGLSDLMNYLSEVASVSPWFYEEDQITDSSVDFLSAEITREKLFLNLHEELPYSTAVITEQFEEKKDKSLVIKQIIFVLKDSHKKIVLGKDGSNIKKINIEARAELEKLFECKVHLFLFVKVRPWIDRPEEYIGNAYSLLVFDIETIPDVNSCKNLLDISDDSSVEEKRDALTKYHLEITNGQNSFLRQPFHQIVVISFLLCSISYQSGYEVFTLQEIRSGGTLNSSEKELVKGFFNYISEKKPRLVSFNGRTFDIPVLKYRAMVHGIQAEYFHKAGDKWNSYNQRYSSDWHCDLLESLSDFGASASVKMNEVCAAFNLPGKIGVDGSQVMGLYDSGKIQEIRDYCETDVINTYLIYLRFMHHQGRITTESYNKSVEELLLECEKKEYLKKFKEEWEITCGGKILLP